MTIATLLSLYPATVNKTFTYVADKDLNSVSVAGTFNDWNKLTNPMTRSGHVWSATIKLPLGKTLYKFVINNDNWIMDPKNTDSESDGNGNTNSRVIATPEGYEIPAKIGDGLITTSGISHETVAPGWSYEKGKFTVRMQTRTNDVASVIVQAGSKSLSLSPISQNGYSMTFGATFPAKGKVEYQFKISDGDKQVFLGADGVSDKPGRKFSVLLGEGDQPALPSWPVRSVVYQIFPDRFANGSTKNDPNDVVSWSEQPTWFNRFGGDIQGVSERLQYLKDLGVGTIYFNPIFQSPANHRYETQDYFKIDPEFGTNDEFAKLTSEFHKAGMKIILDGVFNHTATNFPAFADVVAKGETSKFTNWYFIKSYPVDIKGPNPNYEAWAGFGSMPKLNFANKSVRDYLLAVPNYWAKKANIDGWRLDVPNEVAADFWPQFRSATKKANPQSWIIGEIWGDGSPWLKGDMFDSVMGYQFRSSTQQFIAEGKLTPTEYLGQLTETYASYAPQVSRNLMNLLSSHDTERFITLCGNDPAKHRLAAFLQFTWVGTPSVYYGEELGMTGGKDPENRKPMEWNRVDGNEMLSFYRSLIAARNNSQALQSGIPVVLDTNDKSETLAFARVTENQCVIAAANRSDKPQTISLNLKGKLPDGLVNLHEPFMNLVGHSETQVSGADNLVINLPPKGVCLLAPRKNLSRLKRGKETEPVKSFVSH